MGASIASSKPAADDARARERAECRAARRVRAGLNAAAARDPQLRLLLARLGTPSPRVRPPGFATLLRIVLAQQLSTSVAEAMAARLAKLCRGVVTPRKILNRTDAQLRRCGLSARKIEYARGLARMIARKEFDLDALRELDAPATIAELVKLRGIGPWSAEMYALSALGHADIFPAGDLALQVAVQRYASLRTRPTARQTAAFARRWSPHRSSVALLMWRYYAAPKWSATTAASAARIDWSANGSSSAART